jgi:hypothetical protein
MPSTEIYHQPDATHATMWVEVVPDPRPLADQLADRLAQLAYERWTRSLSVTFGGVAYACDDTAALRLTAAIKARELAQAAGLEATTATAGWKALDGSFGALTLTQQQQLLMAGVAKVQSCFNNEATIAGQLRAATDAPTLDAVDLTQGWPA